MKDFFNSLHWDDFTCINTLLVFGMFSSSTAANLSLAENQCVCVYGGGLVL